MRPRRRPEPSVPADRWLISYADFITLLFAFFVVLFASSYQDKQTIRKLSRAIHQGFQTMGAFSEGQTDFGEPHSSYPTGTLVPASEMPNAGEQQQLPGGAGSGLDIAELRRQLEAAIGKELRDGEVVIRVTPEGFVVSLRELGFFNSGEAVLLPGAAEKIKRIAQVLIRHGLDLRVEGHSDDQPIHTREYRSNWELSTARAMAVVLLLVDDSGFDPRRVSVMGYGQYRPIAENGTPVGRKMNRRVDLVVVAPVAVPAGAP